MDLAYDHPITSALIRGALDLEQGRHGLLPHRLPAWARAQNVDGQLTMAEAQPSGVRLVFRTTAGVVELDTLRTKLAYVGAPDRPDGVYDLLVDGRLAAQGSVPGGDVVLVDLTTGSTEHRPGAVGTVGFAGLPEHDKVVEIWLPYSEVTELVALRADAPIAALDPHSAADRPVWVHHGSSISHGSNAAGPSSTWPAIAAAAGGVELVNLGFGGSAVLDPFVARTRRDTPADLISLKLGINLVNLDLMRLRALGPAVHGFLDTIREGHPTTPLLLVSPLCCPEHEDTPGPSAPDFTDGQVRFVALGDPAERAQGKLTLTAIRAELERIVDQRRATDPHLHYLDGRELYGDVDAVELPLPDGLHPDAAGQRRIGERFAALAFGDGGAFAVRDLPSAADLALVRRAVAVSGAAVSHGNHPFGALLVGPDGTVLLEAENTVVTGHDVTGHAETNLVRLASASISPTDLAACTLVTSCEPCAMCSGAIYWAGIGRVVYGLSEAGLMRHTGAHEENPTLALPCRAVFAAGQRPTTVVGPLLEEEAAVHHLGFWD
ncbi:hypothetical protein BH11ACT8_BH11ACT8_07240 [soil metagenome]